MCLIPGSPPPPPRAPPPLTLFFQPNSPLCVEEFDLSDRNFKPCPCGYQVRFSGHFCHIVLPHLLHGCRSVNSASTIFAPTLTASVQPVDDLTVTKPSNTRPSPQKSMPPILFPRLSHQISNILSTVSKPNNKRKREFTASDVSAKPKSGRSKPRIGNIWQACVLSRRTWFM